MGEGKGPSRVCAQLAAFSIQADVGTAEQLGDPRRGGLREDGMLSWTDTRGPWRTVECANGAVLWEVGSGSRIQERGLG